MLVSLKKFSLSLIRALVITSIVIFAFSVFCLFITLESEQKTHAVHQLDAKSAHHGKQFIKRLYAFTRQQTGLRIVSANQSEIDGVIALGQRAFPRISASSVLSENGATIQGSVRLPLPSFIKYLNVSTIILPSSNGLYLGDVNIGSLTIKGETLITIVTWALDTFVKEDLATKVLSIVKAVKVDKQRMTLIAEVDQSLLDLKSESSLFATLRDKLALLGDVQLIKFYYQSLYDLSKSKTVSQVQQGRKNDSLAYFVNHVFTQAKIRSQNTSVDQAKAENQAALVGLILYFGPEKLKLLVGGLPQVSREDEIKRYYLKYLTTLQGRVDLQKHFIYSIALKLLSTTYASDAVGEFKEFLDANQGGSGFSFADLLADRAGTRLALIVTKNESVYASQQLLSTIDDNGLLPSILGLKEGLNEAVFTQQYIDVQSLEYKNAINDIDMRLKALPLYQLGW